MLAVGVVALQVPIARAAFSLIDASPAVTEDARAYFDVRIWSAPFTFVNYAVLGAVIGRGRTDLGLLLQVIINLVNIVLNIALVTGAGLGVRGSAFGTLAAEALGNIVGLALLARLHPALFRISWPLVLDLARLRRMMAMNRDIMIRTAALIFGFAFFTAQGARGGDVTLAANAVLMNLFLITAFFLDGFATAAEQMCGQSIGARDIAGFRWAVRLTLLWCIAFSSVVTVLALAGGSPFIAVVTTSQAVRDALYLPFAALTPLVGAVAARSAPRACGYAR